MNYKAIIFDMDGTIISSEEMYTEATKTLLKTKGKLSDEECDKILPQLKGASLYTTCTFIKMTYNTQESVEELIQEKKRLSYQQFSKVITLIDGFEQFHNAISNIGLKSAIATNATLSCLEQTKQHVSLEKFFNKHIYSIDHVNKIPKPKPDVFLYAAHQLGIEPEHCIVIEDSTHGVRAAKAAGMFCIGINTGNDRAALSEANIIVEKYDDIDLNQILKFC